MGSIEIDLFPKDVNSLSHPYVEQFRELLEEAAAEYGCSLLTFEIDHGTVSFSFDSDEMTAKILKMLQTEKSDGADEEGSGESLH